ncbi:MAG TPA: Type 1 glutamine amidotransferase-like domain-containing protein [Planctomycetota bacterium]|nr:Type 1 glutamine amidotransferase-like domain-containing protein [Planctomycetota bacterium]
MPSRSRNWRLIALCFVVSFTIVNNSIHAADTPVEPTWIPGYVIIHGGSDLPAPMLDTFVKLSGGTAAKIVYVVAESNSADDAMLLGPFQKLGAASLNVLRLSDKKETTSAKAEFPALKEATGVWLGESTPATPKEFANELREIIARKGVVAGSGVGAAFLAEYGVRLGEKTGMQCKGICLLPSSIVELKASKGNDNDDLLSMLKTYPSRVGFGIGENATLMVHERSVFASGAEVNICLAAGNGRPAREERLAPGARADLIALQRSAIARTLPAFPPAKPNAPELSAGTLVIDGGGFPRVAAERFVQASGGPDALILVIPTAIGDEPPPGLGEGRRLQAAGAKNLKIFHLATRAEAFDEEKIKIIREAKGIWFCGGRQWRYVDRYLDTPAEKLMHELLARGGAIGGSSAGATIQGDYLVRGSPLGNTQMMAEGYERGMGFLKGVAIDQHFVKRNRFADMTELKAAFPQLLGLGIDEGAALVVTGHTLEVIGVGQVCIYDKATAVAKGETDYVPVKAGEKYDLKALAKVEK